ncbi:hypothetical protein CVIRNUC_001707 [Coccomyxa viridis]|uniref:Prolyl 4-hydroxylase alpha subunit Fe(2+) 2OG dioxygenase domain-containing protein n=1 Tax=Coccomyxa viridis TaxID=1274662 RepID=A0AAV1HVL7_9CHLO|nr:hypothetical protein CVIRNUC_001707 [Coccomyxa viridis]
MMHLRQQSAEYQLSVYPYNGAQYVRHRDAFPDDGSEGHQRRVTAILYANPGWSPSDGGKLRLWPPPMIDQAATGPASLHSGHPPPGTSPRAAADRSFSGSTEHTVQHSSGCNDIANGPPGLSGRLSGPEPGCSSLDRDSLPSTTSEAPSGASDDRRLNGGTHLAGVMQSGHADGCVNGSASELQRLAASANGLVACLQAQLHANGSGHCPIANGTHAGLGSDLGSEAASELEHEHPASNGFLADGDSGLYGHHLEASPANGHLHPLRLEPMLPMHFHRQGSMASSMVAEATEASVLDSVQDGASSIDDGGSMDGASARKRAVPASVKQTEIGTEAVVDVAPLAGRLVLFLSGAVEHAVLPNFAQRVALTAWCQ